MKLFARTAVLGVTIVLFVCYNPQADGVHQERSRFAGSYTGPWTGQVSNTVHNGTLTLTVSTDGKLTGTEKDDNTGNTAEVTGTVNEDGDISYTLKYPSGTYKVEGTIARTQKGNLKGTVIQYNGKDVISTYR